MQQLQRSKQQTFNRKEWNVMDEQNNQEPNNQQPLIEDLTVNEAEATDVKGGPIEIRELQIRVHVEP
jgi:hypothetical protein